MEFNEVFFIPTIISFIFLYFNIVLVNADNYSPSDYYASIEKSYQPNWMSAIPDDRLLSDLSIPGTHDSMAVWGNICCLPGTPTGVTADITKLQQRFEENGRFSLFKQLLAGIRAIDIRVRLEVSDNKDDPIPPPQLVIYHGSVYQYANFHDVLWVTSEFLGMFQNETIIMRLKLEGGSDEDSRQFPNVVEKYRDSEPYGKILYYPSVSGYNSISVPKLGAVRGKVVLLLLHGKGGGVYNGFGIRKDLIDIQDVFELSGADASGQKFKYVAEHFDAIAKPANRHKIMVNFVNTATYFYIIPGIFQNGPSAIAHDINHRVYVYLNNNYYNEPRTGILMFDYPGWKLINKIISFNYRFYTK